MSGLADELVAKGFAPNKKDTALYMAALEFFKKNGSKIHAIEVIEKAYERVHPDRARKTPGLLRESADDRLSSPSLTEASGKDPGNGAKNGPMTFVPPARQTLDMTTDAIHDARTARAQTALDKVKTSDGRAWGDVGAHELDGMSRDGKLALAIKNHLGVLTNAQLFKPVRELVSPAVFEQLRSEANAS